MVIAKLYACCASALHGRELPETLSVSLPKTNARRVALRVLNPVVDAPPSDYFPKHSVRRDSHRGRGVPILFRYPGECSNRNAWNLSARNGRQYQSANRLRAAGYSLVPPTPHSTSERGALKAKATDRGQGRVRPTGAELCPSALLPPMV